MDLEKLSDYHLWANDRASGSDINHSCLFFVKFKVGSLLDFRSNIYPQEKKIEEHLRRLEDHVSVPSIS